ncbi:MAG: hypothetical protein IPP85_17660 [Propionivibrio sp.]|nr:hypothetical protein [Propionivibrio sp.]
MWLIHRLCYRPTNHDNFYVRGHKKEGTITAPLDIKVLKPSLNDERDRYMLKIRNGKWKG